MWDEKMLNEKQRKEFEEVSRPLMEFLSNNFHPHIKVTIDYSSVEILEGVYSFRTEDYIKD